MIYIFVFVKLTFRHNIQAFVFFVRGMLVNTQAEKVILSEKSYRTGSSV